MTGFWKLQLWFQLHPSSGEKEQAWIRDFQVIEKTAEVGGADSASSCC